jgi:hypothetical protein
VLALLKEFSYILYSILKHGNKEETKIVMEYSLNSGNMRKSNAKVLIRIHFLFA